MSKRIPLKEATRLEILSKCNNRCCVCQTPFIQIHHIDGNPANNEIDNLAPLCPNCHDQAGLDRQMSMHLSKERIKQLRKRWYNYCEKRKEGSNVSANAILKVKNFVRSVGSPRYGWKKTFAALDQSYKDLTVDEIIERVFSTQNYDDLFCYLETMKYMYYNQLINGYKLEKFINLCNSFGIDYFELPQMFLI